MYNPSRYSEKHKKLRDEKIDLAIIAKGSISLYYNETILDYDINLLKEKNYTIIEFDGNYLSNKEELHYDLKEKLNFPDYYGKNFDAFDDCLSEYEIDENGVVLVFRYLNMMDTKMAHTLLDILVIRARHKFAIGQKLLILVQVNNPKFKITEPIGSVNFHLWNDLEWFESDRQKKEDN